MTTTSLVGGTAAAGAGAAFHAVNPAKGDTLSPAFHAATAADVDRAATLAGAAAPAYGARTGAERGRFLRAIAAGIEANAAALIARAGLETGLPAARLQGETARTCNQLRLFATLVEEGSWVQARIDRAQDRTPAPRKPDLRSMLRPLGPVAVFGASNFPLAFSVAGGDTASALAAGNPVVVKAHPAHPGTSALAGMAIQAAAHECGLPAGVFALLFDAGIEAGVALVRHPAMRAVGFTGSLRGGRALMDLAAARPEPIPVYAEMGSSNPVFILAGALRDRGAEIAAGLHGSVTLGSGQFCTKPGLVMLPAGGAGDALAAKVAELTTQAAAFTMLTPGIADAFAAAARDRGQHKKVQALASGTPSAAAGARAAGAVWQTEAAAFIADPGLAEEVFGPATLLIRHGSAAELLTLARGLHGHLTATVHGTDEDLRENAELISVLQSKVGRLVFNGYPTGVEVTHAMVHGGPYPATSDGRSTSVGTQAIFRFARPVCFQDMPAFALPPELRDENPHGLWRLVEGEMTR